MVILVLNDKNVVNILCIKMLREEKNTTIVI